MIPVMYATDLRPICEALSLVGCVCYRTELKCECEADNTHTALIATRYDTVVLKVIACKRCEIRHAKSCGVAK